MAIEENETKTRRFQVAPSRVLEKQWIGQEIVTEKYKDRMCVKAKNINKIK